MTIHTKLNICLFTAGSMGLLVVFSEPLHIAELFQWVLLIGIFIPLGLTFHFTKKLKQEKIEGAGPPNTLTKTELKKEQRKRILLVMGIGSAVGLCSPLWLPLTGSSLGAKGDFATGIITAAIVCIICVLRLRKI
ncbi:MAG: hypothetical protein NTW65_10525 [Deltaproteobacteria bacterium]|nr:hypothetical protein [Deltaproteobacteria bacterium]